MRYFVLAAIAAIFPAITSAGSLENPWERPPVMTPAQPTLSWNGLYAGVGVTKQTKTVTNTYEEESVSRSCKSSNPSSHNGKKCQISEDDFNHLSGTGEFDVVKSPWSKNLDGPVIYDGGSYYGLWMNGESEVSFSTVDTGTAPTSANKPTDNLLVTTITDVFTLGEDEEVTANAFAGYRHLFGASGLAAGLEVGSVGGVEGQLAMAQGRWFSYVGFNSEEEFTVGTDRLMGDQGNWFLGAKFASGESSRGELRIGIKF